MSIRRYAAGDYVKVELPDEATGVAEWVWIQVTDCDVERELIMGNLDNEPLNDFGDRLRLGSSMAVSYAQIREHRKASDFTKH